MAVQASATGPDPYAVVFEAVAGCTPQLVLEAGCGRGELAERMARELDARVVAVDQSERMVELTTRRGVEAIVGDVQDLPFRDGIFDCAVAAWMLYHVADLDLGLSELARVLRPGGRLVAVTNSARNLRELWGLYGERSERVHPFAAEEAAGILERYFANVERRDAVGTVTFPSWEDAHAYVKASPARGFLADDLPRFEGPLVATRSVAVFVARRAAAA
jgi:ubiquinone/menaquinone biosynthesis C-methylase UbiE